MRRSELCTLNKIVDLAQTGLRVLNNYALDVKAYHDTKEEVTWENSSLREWLNSEFYNSAFSVDEQDSILMADVAADSNPDYDTDPGKDTQDKVFLLSAAEAEELFGVGKFIMTAENVSRQNMPSKTGQTQVDLGTHTGGSGVREVVIPDP